MKNLLLGSTCYLFSIVARGQVADKHMAIIPEPVKMVQSDGFFQLPENISVEAPALASLQPTLLFLKNRLTLPTGYKVKISDQPSNAPIRLRLLKPANELIGKEGYLLNVTPNMITISANEAAGLFYGVQTLLQLLPASIENDKAIQNSKWTLPCVEITDYPRFGWRGLMFDVSRHF